MREEVQVTMLQIRYKFNQGDVTLDAEARLFAPTKARDDSTSAPWDIHVTLLWGDQVLFDRPLAGMDPLHAVHLASQFAANYLHDRAKDEGGSLEPEIFRI